jgi:uncharacterized membrane protein YgaE (UPF0421/DUF939 family)
MERLFYIAIGFVVAVVLVVVFLVAKDVAENKKSLLEQKILSIARKECLDAKAHIYWHNIIGLEQHVNKLIDSKLTEKEGEHETD